MSHRKPCSYDNFNNPSLVWCSECAESPTNVTVTFPGDDCGDTPLIEWNAPATGQVDSYLAECVSSTDMFNKTTQSGVTAVEVGPLSTNQIKYSCSVVARNAAGSSDPGTAEPFVTR